MKTNSRERGASVMEFAIVGTALAFLLIGVGAFGVNMIRVQQTTQVAREAGQMFARGVDFSTPGTRMVLESIASSLGLEANGDKGSAVVILSALTYVDQPVCAAAGAVDQNGNPSRCTNFGKWVFTQRLTVGNSSLRSSNLGSPLAHGPSGVKIDQQTGKISVDEYATSAGALADFRSMNPYSNVKGVVSGLPSGQYIYIAEAAASTYRFGSFTGSPTYAFGIF